MKPSNRVRRAILLACREGEPDLFPVVPLDTDEQVEAEYAARQEDGDTCDAIDETEQEFREGQVETGLDAPYSRHYEAKEVAAQMSDGGWVGWTYWYGGGKHGEPDAVEWIDDAYDLDVTEEQKVVTVRTWKKKES